MYQIIAFIIYLLSNSAGILIIKNFLNNSNYKEPLDLINFLTDVRLIAGMVLYIIGFLTWIYLLSKMDLNMIYPIIVTSSFILILILSTLILKERFTINIFIGTIMCIIGISIIVR